MGYVFGIDLGTTYSCIAYLDDYGKPVVLRNSDGANTTPSVVMMESEENIIVDKASGKNLNRPGYQALKGVLGLRKGDTLVIQSLDRLSRNKEEMKQEIQWFKENEICLQVIDLPTTMIQLGEGQE